jgi:TolB-like protein
MIRIVTLLVVLRALIATPAQARQVTDPGVQRVAVVRLSFAGEIPEAGKDMFGGRLVQGLTAARFQVLATAGLRDTPAGVASADCSDPSCYPGVARKLGVGYLVVGSVTENSKTYQIALDLINGRTGAIMGSVRQQCETCGIEEAGEKMDLAASALRARLEAATRVPARFVIRSHPSDVSARIDGRVVGRTPLDIELAGGEHHLVLSLGGHEPLNRTFIVVSGVDESMDLTLLATTTTFPYRAVGWTALTGGVLAIAAGAIALIIDGREVSCTAADQDPKGHCPLVRQTSLLGAVLLGVGSAAATVGGVSIYLGSRGGVSPEPSGQRPFGIAFDGRF